MCRRISISVASTEGGHPQHPPCSTQCCGPLETFAGQLAGIPLNVDLVHVREAGREVQARTKSDGGAEGVGAHAAGHRARGCVEGAVGAGPQAVGVLGAVAFGAKEKVPQAVERAGDCCVRAGQLRRLGTV